MSTPEEDTIEGVDVSEDYGWGGGYPLDAVFVTTQTRTVVEVVRRIRNGRYQLDPDFQRDFLWDPKRQSRLIESCLMRIPLPVFYLAERSDGVVAVVDGLQRLSTFTRFLNDQLELVFEVNDGVKHPLHGLKFSSLSMVLQERIEDTQLVLYILDSNAPERAKLDIFERVNGGVPLSRQQMRNCIHSGNATKWLKMAAECDEFIKASGASLDKRKMRDREMINRFCAFYIFGSKAYHSGDMDNFLARVLVVMNSMSEEDLAEMFLDFKRSMLINMILFGEHAFRKSLASTHGGKSVFNVALFDVCSVAFSKRSDEVLYKNIQAVHDIFINLLGDYDFFYSISSSTNSVKQVGYRFDRVDQEFEAIGL